MSHADRILIHSFSGFKMSTSSLGFDEDLMNFISLPRMIIPIPIDCLFCLARDIDQWEHIPSHSKNGLTLQKGGLCIPMWVVGWLYIIPFVRFCWLNHAKSSGFGDQKRYLLLAYDIWIYLVFSNVPKIVQLFLEKHAESEYSCRNTVRCRNTKTSFCAYGDACQRSIWSWVPCDEVIQLVVGDVCGHPKPQRCRCANMIKYV